MAHESRIASCCTAQHFERVSFSGLAAFSSHLVSNPQPLAARLAAFGLVTASAGFGAVYAWHTGLEHGQLMASIAVLMALSLELAKPLALAAALSAVRSFSLIRAPLLALLAFVAIAYSVTAELSLIAMMRGDAVAERAAATQAAKFARQERETLTTELSAIGDTRPAAAIEAELTAKLGSDGRLRGCDGRWLASDTARTICGEVAKLRAEKATADRRAQLEAGLVSLRDTGAAHSVEKAVDPGAIALSAYLSALGMVVDAGLISQLLVLVPVLALEVGSALAALLVQAFPFAKAAAATSKCGLPMGQVQAEAVQVVHANKMGSSDVHAVEREKVKNAILERLKESGGELTGGERGIAKLIGASRPTMRRAVNALVIAGAVAAVATKNGTVLRLLS